MNKHHKTFRISEYLNRRSDLIVVRSRGRFVRVRTGEQAEEIR